MDYTQNSFTRGNILPKYVAEETLKRSRVETTDGPAIRVKTIASDMTDLSTLENNTTQIKNSNNDIKQVLGTTNDSSTTNTVVGLLKRIHSTTDESIEQIIEDINTLQTTKADKNNTYTRTEISSALSLKADKSDTYTKTEVNNALNLKADKNDTYTKTQVDNMVSNYVTIDTNQNVTGTKNCSELYATRLVVERFVIGGMNYTDSANTHIGSDPEDQTLCSLAYIRTLLNNLFNLVRGYVMNTCYPVNSVYLTKTYFELSSDGKTAGNTNTPLDYGTWEMINKDDSPGVLGLIKKTGELGGIFQGSKKLILSNLPDHAHQGIITYEGYKPIGGGSTAVVPADAPNGNKSRTNLKCSTTNTIGTAHSTNFTARGEQTQFQPYGYYVYVYVKTGLI